MRRTAARLGAEFVVIVLGVLVALGVDEWRGVRADRMREAEYYRALVEDLERDLAEYDHALAFIDTSSAATRDVLTVVEGRPRPDGAGSLAEAVRRASWVNYPSVASGTVDELVASGAVRLLRNPELKRDLLAYHDHVNEWAPRLQGPEYRTFLEYRRATRGFGLIRSLDLGLEPGSDVEDPGEGEEALAALDRDLVARLPGDRELRGILRGMISEWGLLTVIFRDQRERAEALRDRIAALRSP